MTLRAILDPTINYTAYERGRRVVDYAQQQIAFHLPKRIKMWAYISFATEHMHEDEEVPNVRMADLLSRYKEDERPVQFRTVSSAWADWDPEAFRENIRKATEAIRNATYRPSGTR